VKRIQKAFISLAVLSFAGFFAVGVFQAVGGHAEEPIPGWAFILLGVTVFSFFVALIPLLPLIISQMKGLHFLPTTSGDGDRRTEDRSVRSHPPPRWVRIVRGVGIGGLAILVVWFLVGLWYTDVLCDRIGDGAIQTWHRTHDAAVISQQIATTVRETSRRIKPFVGLRPPADLLAETMDGLVTTGEAGSEPLLVAIQERAGTERTATILLNSGNSVLEGAGRAWAFEHGFAVKQVPRSAGAPTAWGKR
jgi:hypothetical protein